MVLPEDEGCHEYYGNDKNCDDKWGTPTFRHSFGQRNEQKKQTGREKECADPVYP